jgi:DNA-binding MarR family transcriptional regulator
MSPSRRTDSDLDDRLLTALERLANAHRAWLQTVATEEGLTPMQVQLLTIVAKAPVDRRRVSALAREMNVRQPTVTDAVSTLESKGLVERLMDDTDARVSIIELTTAGRRLVRRIAENPPVMRKRLSATPTENKSTSLGLALDLIAGLCEDGVVSVVRSCSTCTHFKAPRKANEAGQCRELNISLPPSALRVDCPVHESRIK